MNSTIIRSIQLSLVSFFLSFTAVSQTVMPDSVMYVYKLYGQTRRYNVRFSENNDTLYFDWGIERNLKWQKGRFAMTPESRLNASLLSYHQPIDGNYMVLPENEVFGIFPLSILNELKKNKECRFDSRSFQLVDTNRRAGGFSLLHLISKDDGTEMWVLDNESLPLIYSMQNNPCGVNWTINSSLPISEVRSGGITDDMLRTELKLDKLRTGGIYFAYPLGSSYVSGVNQIEYSSAPEGYEPFYISHYGRHGSRYMMNDSDYVKVIKPLEYASSVSGITPLGEEILSELSLLWKEAKGRSGELTSKGADQHKGIAYRMYNRYSAVFNSGKKIDAISSTSLRCVLSMNAFCSQISEMNDGVDISINSSNRFMEYMAYTSPELKEFSSPDMPWQKDAVEFEKSILNPERVMNSIFTRHDLRPEDEISYYKALFRVISSIQNTDFETSLYKVFTNDELYSLWKALNYRMYVINGACPLNNGMGPASASTLLRKIMDDADCAINNGDVSVSLRFGHDTTLIRLLALMKVEGCASAETDNRCFHLAWQDYNVSPMGANLQMIFYKNTEGNVLVKFLHNEREVSIDSSSSCLSGKYYDWERLKKEWESIL